MNTVDVSVDMEQVEGLGGDVADRFFSHECEHAAMVMMISVDIEQILTADQSEPTEDVSIATLADVGDAFEHRLTLPGPAPGGESGRRIGDR